MYVPNPAPHSLKDLLAYTQRELTRLSHAAADSAPRVAYLTNADDAGTLSAGISANWKITGGSVVRLSLSATLTLTGLADKTPNRVRTLINTGGADLVLLSENAASSASHRFALARTLHLSANDSVTLWYDPKASRHRAISTDNVLSSAAASTEVIAWRYLRPNTNDAAGTGFTSDDIFTALQGTGSFPGLATNTLMQTFRLRKTAATAAVNSSGGWYANFPEGGVIRSTTLAAYLGFRCEWLIGFEGTRTDQRVRIGLRNTSGAPSTSADPSAETNAILLAKDQGDTNLQFMVNDGTGTCTKTDTGFTMASLMSASIGLLHRFVIDVAANGNTTMTLTNLETGATFSATATTDLPGDAAGELYPCATVNTGGATATSVSLYTAEFKAGARAAA